VRSRFGGQSGSAPQVRSFGSLGDWPPISTTHASRATPFLEDTSRGIGIRALFVSHHPAISGADITLAHYVRARRGQHAVLMLGRGPCAEFYADAGADVRVVEVMDPLARLDRHSSIVGASIGAARVAMLSRSIAKAIRASECDVIVTNSMKSHASIPYMGRITRRPVGFRLQDIVATPILAGPALASLRLASAMTESTAAISLAVAAAGSGLRNVTCFHNGIPEPQIARESAPPGGRLRVLIVSQITQWKGIHVGLRAFAAALAAGLDAELNIVGDAIFGRLQYRDAVRKLAQDLGISDRVHWHGWVQPVDACFAQSDVLLHLPIEPEPLGQVVLEAQAMGLPVVASDGGGIPEIVRSGTTGYLVPHGDWRQAGARLVELDDVRLRRALGAAGRCRVLREFSMERYAQEFDRWLGYLNRRKAGSGMRRPA
jgi:glycosyltransferase involved in cell wall biosynthesis